MLAAKTTWVHIKIPQNAASSMNQLIGNSPQGGCLNQPVPFKGYMNTPKHSFGPQKKA